ncbi:MAG: GDSL-type esterase/lipase family protein [Anaerolineae bacterium]
MPRRFVLMFVLLNLVVVGRVWAQPDPFAVYDMGTPQVTALYVSPTGDDGNDGSAPERALRTVEAAWQRIPMGTELADTGYHILLLPGTYALEDVPGFMESRYGTFEYPVIFEAANGPNTVFLPPLNVYDGRYIYFINLNIASGTDAFHCEKCDHLLLRGNTFVGAEPDTYNTQETVKVNQSQHVFIEGNDFSGAWDNVVDFVAVQYGHFFGNRIHNAGDWCMYLKGGSAYFLVAGNEFYDCGAGGFTAGQGTGWQYMTDPWLDYEAYDIKVVNNVIHDSAGAGLGVQGGYNILMAYNTLYKVGERSHVLEFGFGSRSCDGQPGDEGRERCDAYLAAGHWGNVVAADGTNFVRIPNRNVYVVYNLIYNPPGYRSAYQQLSVFPPYAGAEQAGTTVPSPARADDNLVIRGNLIWNGDATMPLGIEGGDQPSGCQPDNPTCNSAQLLADNVINSYEPILSDPERGNYLVVDAGGFSSQDTPDFTWDVAVPPGNLSNRIPVDYAGEQREFVSAPGAFISGSGLVLVGSAQMVEATPVPQVIEATAVPQINPPPPSLVAGEALPPGPLTIVTLGDSLTEGAEDNAGLGGYPGRLLGMVQALRPGSILLNVGHSGWNSDALINGDQGLPSELAQAEEAIRAAVGRGEPALALVWIGSNDLFYLYEYNNPDAAGEQADLDNYSRNWDIILSRLTGAGARVMLALLDDQSLRPVVQRGEAFPGTSREEITQMSAQVRRYNDLIMQKAAQYGAGTVDFFNTSIFTDAATLADDGNHPNASGYDVAAQIWMNALLPLLAN